MKPRAKARQKQNGRMVLRKQDHRDVLIYNSTDDRMMYHNLTVLHDEEGKKLVWQKYPSKALILGVSPYSSGGALAVSTWLDVKRHMLYRIGSGNPNSTSYYQVLRVQNLAVDFIYDGFNTKLMASEDGMIFHKDNDALVAWNVTNFKPKPIGLYDELCVHSYTNNTANGTLVRFSLEVTEDDDEFLRELDASVENLSLVFGENSPVSYLLGNTESGVLIARRKTETNIDYGVFYHVSNNGYVNEVFNWRTLSPNHIGYDNYNYLITNTANRDCMVKVGTDYFIANIWHDVSASTQSSHKEWWRVLYCNGDLTDWKIAPLDYFFTPQIGEIGRMVVFARGNRVYAFCGTQAQEKNVRLFCTDDHENWFELNLPPYKDIPLEEYGGSMVKIPTGGYDYVRIKFDTSSESAVDGYNVNMWDGLDGHFFQYGQFGMSDGELINSDSDEEFGLAVQIGRILIYSPTVNFLPNDDLQAYYINGNGDGVLYDFVINGDYVLSS